MPNSDEEELNRVANGNSSFDNHQVSVVPGSEMESLVDCLSAENGDSRMEILQDTAQLPISIEEGSESLHENRMDHDNGILVNMDGSMEDRQSDGNLSDDAGKEDMFVDAEEELTVVGGRNTDDRESMVIPETQENMEKKLDGQDHHGATVMEDRRQIHPLMDELETMRAELDKKIEEKDLMEHQYKEHKEEREMLAEELASLRHQLQLLTNQQLMPFENNDRMVDHLHCEETEDRKDMVLDMPLHVMVNDCSKLTLHLKNVSEEHLQSLITMRELHAVLFAKDQEIEDLIAKVTELSVSHDVVVSSMASLQKMCSKTLKESSDVQVEGEKRLELVNKRLLDSLALDELDISDDSITDEISLIEKRTTMLVENYTRFLSKMSHFVQCLSEVSSDFVLPGEREFGVVFDIACDKILEQKRKEFNFLEKIEKIEGENQKLVTELEKMKEKLQEANAETSKTKNALGQTESKLISAKEKLSMAVTKGKALVQQRDSLRQSLNEKTNELEKCLLELQQKSSALEAAKVSSEELVQSQNFTTSLQEILSQRNTVFHQIEELILEINTPEEIQSKELIDRVRWLVDDKNTLEGTLLELKESLWQRDTVIQQIEEILLGINSFEDTRSMELVDKARWLADQMNILEGIFLENRKVKDALSSIDLPETISDTSLEHQISWLLTSLARRNAALQEIEELISWVDAPNDVQSMGVIDKVRWLVDQKSISESIFMQIRKLKDAFSSIDLPETVSGAELELQIRWLLESFAERNAAVQDIEEVISQVNAMEEIQSMEVTDKVRWLVDQKNISEGIFLESRMVKDALSSIDLPETVSGTELQQQMNWLLESFGQSKTALQEIEKVMSQVDAPEKIQSMEVVDKIRWLVNKKNSSDGTFLECHKLKDALSSIDLPETVLDAELELQINWLLESFSAKHAAIQEVGKVISQINAPEKIQSMEVVDKVRWLVDQKHGSGAIFLESHKLKDALSSIDLPETVAGAELELQINWLVESFAQKNAALQEIEVAISQFNVPEEIKSMEVMDKVRWLVDQKNNSEGFFLESCKLRDALSSIDLPETLLGAEVETQINWLLKSFTQRNAAVQEIEEVLSQVNASEEIKSVELIDKVRWLVDKKSISEGIFLENQKLKDALSSTSLPETILGAEVGMQVKWLLKSFAQRNTTIQEIEEVISEVNMPDEIKSMEVIDKVRWLVDEKSISESIFLENLKLKNVVSSFDLPERVLSTDLESQINWLGNSLSQAKNDVIKLQDEIISNHSTIASHGSALSEARKEMDKLTATLLEENQEKVSVEMRLEELECKHRELDEKSSWLSAEKDRLMTMLLEVCGSTLEMREVGGPSGDIDSVVEKYFLKMKERADISSVNSLFEKEQFQTLQRLLYVRYQELTLCEMMLEEEMLDRSKMMIVSNELKRLSEEVETMKSERDSLQKDLARAEEKSSLIREKLSMAVKKGKRLVQERESFKLSLEEKTKEIEKLKYELKQREIEVTDRKDQIKSLSGDLECIPKLESDVIAIKDQRNQIEGFLQESHNMLKRLVDAVDCIVLPTNIVLEEPIKKLKWLGEYIQESQAGKIHMEKELDKAKEEAGLLAAKLRGVYETIESLKDALMEAEKNISILSDEKNEAEAGKTCLEEELEKARAKVGLQANKLTDAFVTIRSLEEALSHAESSISVFAAANEEAESKSKQEIIKLNAMLAQCMEELAENRGRLENQASELASYLSDIHKHMMKGEGLISSLTEGFKKEYEGLRNVALLIQDIRGQFGGKKSELQQLSPSIEKDLDMANALAVPHLEDHLSDTLATSESASDLHESVPSYLAKIVVGLNVQNKLLGRKFEYFSTSMDEHIAVLLQGLQATKDDVIHMLEVMEALKLNVSNLEAKTDEQENMLSVLTNDIAVLLSACSDATQEWQIYAHNCTLDLNSNLELENQTEPYSGSIEADWDTTKEQQEKLGASAYSKLVENMLLGARRVRVLSEQFENAKSMWHTNIENLQNKLQESKLTAENAMRDKDINLNRITKLEADHEALESFCREMKLKLENYEAKEDNLREKEAELSLLSSSLAANSQGADEYFLSEIQVNNLLNKVNNIQIPFSESEMDGTRAELADPADKLFYIIDNFVELQNSIDSFTNEKEGLQLQVSDQVREIEQLKKEAESFMCDSMDFQTILAELKLGLQRIIQKIGGNDSLEDIKTANAVELLPVLEKLVLALIMESENSKSKAQEMGIKFQGSQKAVDELSDKVKLLENSVHDMPAQPKIMQEQSVLDRSSVASASEISETEDTATLGKSSSSPVPAAAHVRQMRKGSSDHLALNIDLETDRLINHHEMDDKGHVFKSLNTSGLIPKQGKLIADRIDGIWVSGGRILMSRPGARIGLIAYWLFLHIWVLGTIL